MCNNQLRICCFIGFICFSLFALAIVCSQVWNLRWRIECTHRGHIHGALRQRETAIVVTAHPPSMDYVSVSTVASATTMKVPETRYEPLVFNVPEVPNEVRGVFHRSTGVVNYTALVEFVKNISSPTYTGMHK